MLLDLSYTATILNLGSDGCDIGLYHQSLALRHRVLIGQLGWNLPTFGHLETDQYDTLFAHHVLLLDQEKVIATLRLLPTDLNLFGSTYMILDAHRGTLPGLPSGLMEQEIVDPGTWEASRLAICSSIPPENRNHVLGALIREAISFIQARGGTAMLGLMNPVFSRVFKRIGINVSIAGPIKEQKDGPICVLKYDF